MLPATSDEWSDERFLEWLADEIRLRNVEPEDRERVARRLEQIANYATEPYSVPVDLADLGEP